MDCYVCVRLFPLNLIGSFYDFLVSLDETSFYFVYNSYYVYKCKDRHVSHYSINYYYIAHFHSQGSICLSPVRF